MANSRLRSGFPITPTSNPSAVLRGESCPFSRREGIHTWKSRRISIILGSTQSMSRHKCTIIGRFTRKWRNKISTSKCKTSSQINSREANEAAKGLNSEVNQSFQTAPTKGQEIWICSASRLSIGVLCFRIRPCSPILRESRCRIRKG